MMTIDTQNIRKNGVSATKSKLDYYINKVQEITPKSACCKDKSDCITVATRPLLITYQLLGIFPITFQKKNCRFSHVWFSFPSVINVLVVVATILSSICVLFIAEEVISGFRGTDLYTTAVVIVTQFTATVVVFAVGNFCAQNFCKGWQTLHDAADKLELQNYRKMRQYLLFVPAALIFEGSFNALTVSIYTNQENFRVKASPYTAFFGSLIANFIPNLITFSFAVILSICGYLFECLNQSIFACLEQRSSDFLSINSIAVFPHDHASKLAKLRQTHEDLCEAVRLLGKAFGFQILVIFAATGLRFIVGIYAVITEIFGLTPPAMKGFVGIQGFASILAVIRIMIVILSSDAVTTKATEALKSLKQARCPSNSDEVNEEIDVFLSKIASFPLEIRCCGIITLKLSFFATAVPNVITYVLVLMQFKQSDENNACSILQNTTTQIPIFSN